MKRAAVVSFDMFVVLSRPLEMENPSSGGRLWLQMENEGSSAWSLEMKLLGRKQVGITILKKDN